MSEFDGHTPTLSQAITKGAERAIDASFSALPCKIKTIREDFPGAVDLTPLVLVLNDAGEPIELSVIPCVPVAIWMLSPFVFTAPLKVGATGTALVHSRAITQWLVSGSASATPEGKRRGNRTDAIFIPNLQPYTARPEAEQSDRLVLGLDSGRVGITIDETGTVYAGAEATVTDSAVLSTPLTIDLGKIVADFNQLIGVISGLGGLFAPTFTSVTNNAANKLKAE